jgi:hypothetical protein
MKVLNHIFSSYHLNKYIPNYQQHIFMKFDIRIQMFDIKKSTLFLKTKKKYYFCNLEIEHNNVSKVSNQKSKKIISKI